MGVRIGFVAVTSDLDGLISAFAQAWPTYEQAVRASLASLEDYGEWQKQHARFVSAKDWSLSNASIEVFGFMQEGPWSILLDNAYVLCADEAALADLSATFGRCLSFILDSAGAMASFMCFQQGALVRRITSVDGIVSASGEPLPEESDMTMNTFGPQEAGALQRRIGLHFLSELPPREIVAVACIDRRDYTSSSARSQMAAEAQPGKQPWWKLW